MKKVKGITFDVWNTLITGGNKDYRRGKSEIIKSCLETSIEADKLREIMIAADVYYNNLTDETGGDYSLEPRIIFIHQHLKELNQTSLYEINQSIIQKIDQALGNLVKQYPPFLIENDLLQSLASLKERNIQLGLISNTGTITGPHMRIALSVRGVMQYMNTAIFSSEVKRGKPHPELFLSTAKNMGLSSEEILHVGDNVKADFLGAKNANFQTIHFDPKGISEYPSIKTIKELLSII